MSDNQPAIGIVRFVRAWECCMRDDVAAFPLPTAQQLVRTGFAVWQIPGH